QRSFSRCSSAIDAATCVLTWMSWFSMSWMSCRIIFSGSSARSIRSLMLARRIVLTRSRIPIAWSSSCLECGAGGPVRTAPAVSLPAELRLQLGQVAFQAVFPLQRLQPSTDGLVVRRHQAWRGRHGWLEQLRLQSGDVCLLPRGLRAVSVGASVVLGGAPARGFGEVERLLSLGERDPRLPALPRRLLGGCPFVQLVLGRDGGTERRAQLLVAVRSDHLDPLA